MTYVWAGILRKRKNTLIFLCAVFFSPVLHWIETWFFFSCDSAKQRNFHHVYVCRKNIGTCRNFVSSRRWYDVRLIPCRLRLCVTSLSFFLSNQFVTANMHSKIKLIERIRATQLSHWIALNRIEPKEWYECDGFCYGCFWNWIN